ncbi:MAG TPA: ADP-ribosylglycohydrolase, partial [Firmicutes bacterium]|nr:ADP-ribosylglycohydrolase [Bacillota bacterium]
MASIAIGDALGFPGHDLTQEEIARRFNGPLTAFHDALPDNPYHEGVTAGSITDDTMMTLLFAEAMLDETTPKDAYFFGRVLAKWA